MRGRVPVRSLSALALAFSAPQFHRIPLGEARVVPAVRAKLRQRQIKLPVEREFRRDYLERGAAAMLAGPAVRAADHLVKNRVRDVLDGIRQVLRDLGRLVRLLLRVLPEIALPRSLLLGQRKIFLRDGVVVEERGNLHREVIPIPVLPALRIPVRHRVHVLYDLRHQGLVLILRILLIQDAVLLAPDGNATEQVLGAVAVEPVPDAVRIPDDSAERAVAVVHPDTYALVHHLRLSACARTGVVGILEAIGPPVGILHVLRLPRQVEAVIAIPGILDVIPHHVLGAVDVRVAVDGPQAQFLQLFAQPGEALPGVQTQFGGFLLIFLFGILPVEDTIAFVPQAGAGDAIRTVRAVIQEIGVAAALRVPAEEQTVGILAVDVLVPVFSFVADVGIRRVLAVRYPVAVDGILVVPAGGDQVAILMLDREIAVLGVHRLAVEKREERGLLQKLLELLEKGFVEIVAAAVGQRIPFVRPPEIQVIDAQAPVRGINGNYVLRMPGGVAFAAVEGPFVPLRQAPLQAALRAPGRRRHLHLLVETEVLRLDDEFSLAIGANSDLPSYSGRFGGHGYMALILPKSGLRVKESAARTEQEIQAQNQDERGPDDPPGNDHPENLVRENEDGDEYERGAQKSLKTPAVHPGRLRRSRSGSLRLFRGFPDRLKSFLHRVHGAFRIVPRRRPGTLAGFFLDHQGKDDVAQDADAVQEPQRSEER